MAYQANFLLVGNASYLNRGCEAILRGTVKILRHVFGDCSFVNANFDVTDPPFIPDERDPHIAHRPLPAIRRLSAKWVGLQTAQRLYPTLAQHMRFGSLRDDISQSRAALSIGGDNYSLDYGIPMMYINLDRYILTRGIPLIIWGASIGPFDSKPDMASVIHEHLRREVSAIFVRERRSLDYLCTHGISDNVYLMSDPAFLMEADPVLSSELGFEMPDGAIGLNLSPLISHYVGDHKVSTLSDTGTCLVEVLCSKLGRPVVLIPHVTSPHSNDYELLREMYDGLRPKYREHVYLLPNDINAAKTKWVISKLSCLIAARTHATIAGFSTCVPTVSLAYSVKAFGINEDLFGHTDYVVRPNEFSLESIVNATEKALSNSAEIRKTLGRKMTDNKDLALAAGIKFRELMEL
jgi:colanic acid/amylovoran biosynthesis protein